MTRLCGHKKADGAPCRIRIASGRRCRFHTRGSKKGHRVRAAGADVGRMRPSVQASAVPQNPPLVESEDEFDGDEMYSDNPVFLTRSPDDDPLTLGVEIDVERMNRADRARDLLNTHFDFDAAPLDAGDAYSDVEDETRMLARLDNNTGPYKERMKEVLGKRYRASLVPDEPGPTFRRARVKDTAPRSDSRGSVLGNGSSNSDDAWTHFDPFNVDKPVGKGEWYGYTSRKRTGVSLRRPPAIVPPY